MADLIDRAALLEEAHWIIRSDGTRVYVVHVEDVENAPAVDAVHVVRCKDCEYQHTIECPMNYEVNTFDEDDGFDSYMTANASYDDGFCWCGDRRKDEI